MKSPDRKLSRRNFLAAVGAGSASAAVALVATDKLQESASSAKPGESQGYRLTEHVRNYYRTAKV